MKNICNKLRWLFLFSFGFSNLGNPLKELQHSPHNKKLLDQQNSNQEEWSKNSKEKSSETKFNQILFSSAPGEVEETSKIEEKRTSEINEIQKIENKEKTKTINVISSKVDKQIFFDVIDKNSRWRNTKKTI